jgi:hypothetical protein
MKLPSHKGRLLPLAIAFSGPVVVLTLVRIFVVNMPFLDEWQWSPMMVHLRLGQIDWSEIWPLHNEQRIVVPSLVAMALAAIRHNWVITRETTFSVGILFATLGVWWAVIVKLVPAPRREWVLALISLLASSLTQAENWTWGFQLSFFISNLCAAVITLSFVMADRRWSLPIGLVALIVAAHSIGFGLTGTLSGMLYYALRRERWKFVTWTVVSTIIVFSYVHDFQAGLYHPIEAPLLARILMTVNFALVVLGAPIGRSSGTLWCGLLGLTALIGVTAYGFMAMRGSEERKGSVVLLALAAMPVVGAFEIAYGRLFEGLGAALGGRFTTPISLLWIALSLAVSRLDARPMRLATIGAIPLAVFWIASQIAGYDEFRDRSLALFAAGQVIPRWDRATEDEFRPLWPAEVFLDSLHTVGDGPFFTP